MMPIIVMLLTIIVGLDKFTPLCADILLPGLVGNASTISRIDLRFSALPGGRLDA
jgi:hypothetical protein